MGQRASTPGLRSRLLAATDSTPGLPHHPHPTAPRAWTLCPWPTTTAWTSSRPAGRTRRARCVRPASRLRAWAPRRRRRRRRCWSAAGCGWRCCATRVRRRLREGLQNEAAAVSVVLPLLALGAGTLQPAPLLSPAVRGLPPSVLASAADHFREWAALEGRPGINFIDPDDFDPAAVERQLAAARGAGADLALCVMHWGRCGAQRSGLSS